MRLKRIFALLTFSILVASSLSLTKTNKVSAISYPVNLHPICDLKYSVDEVNNNRSHWDGTQYGSHNVKGISVDLGAPNAPYVEDNNGNTIVGTKLVCENTKVYAAFDGVVRYVSDGCGEKMVVLENASLGVKLWYVHTDIAVAENSTVQAGQKIGKATGKGCGGGYVHTHLTLVNYSNGNFLTYGSDYSSAVNQWEFVNPTTDAGASTDDTFFIGDFNGDNKQDLIAGTLNGDEDKLKWKVSQSNGSGFGTQIEYASSYGRASWKQFRVGDFNGDGRSDLAAALLNGDEDKLRWKVATSKTTTDGFNNSTTWIESMGRDSYREFLVGDFNGDGKDDIASANENGDEDKLVWKVSLAKTTGDGFEDPVVWIQSMGRTSYHKFLAGDFDGDGKDDIASANENGDADKLIWKVSLANTAGNGFENPVVWIQSMGRTSYHKFLAADFDGDGKDDIASTNENGDEDKLVWKVSSAKTTGDGFENPVVWKDVFGRSSYYLFTAADINGDGRYDLLAANENGDEDKLTWLGSFSEQNPDGFGTIVTVASVFGRKSWRFPV